jgi:hypothetical protein
MTASNWVQSARWPGVTPRDTGRQRPSADRWILVVKPPRERPSASPAAPPPPGGRRAVRRSCPGLSNLGPPSGSTGGGGAGRAAAACWWARTAVESTEISQWIWPSASALGLPAAAGSPRCHHRTIGGAAHRRSSTVRSGRAGPARAPRSGSGTRSHRSPGGGRATAHTGHCSPAGTAPAVPTPHRLDPPDLPCLHYRRATRSAGQALGGWCRTGI